MGADGRYSLTLRLIAVEELLLEPTEYQRVVESTAPFVLYVQNNRLYFGAAENVSSGVGFAVENGRYVGNVVSLRTSRGLKLITTMVKSDKPVSEIAQLAELREP